MAAAVAKVVATGKTVTQVVDGKITTFTAGQTVLLSPADSVAFVSAGLVNA